VLNTAVSLLTLMLAQTTALQTAEAGLRTTIFELLADGEIKRAEKLAHRLWGGLPTEPLRLLLVAGSARGRDDLAEALSRTIGLRSTDSAGERVFHAEVDDQLVVVYPAGGSLRGRVLAAAAGPAGLTAGESSDGTAAELARARREAEQALTAGLRADRRFTSFADIGAAGLLSLLAGPTATAFAGSLLRPLITHDVTGRGDLVRSLGAWLEHNGEWDAAAVSLGIHRHTLRNRMRRVAELLGRDLDVAAVRAELWVGLRVLDAIGVGADRPAPAESATRSDGPERRLVR
jgi:PucR family transcriptional regulator, purine catabolism regulatory protein